MKDKLIIGFTEEQKKILYSVIDKFGQARQLFKLIKEMSELSRAISMLAQDNAYNSMDGVTKLRENIISEMIDVEIVLWQLLNDITLNPSTLSFYQAEKLRKFEKIKKMMED